MIIFTCNFSHLLLTVIYFYLSILAYRFCDKHAEIEGWNDQPRILSGCQVLSIVSCSPSSLHHKYLTILHGIIISSVFVTAVFSYFAQDHSKLHKTIHHTYTQYLKRSPLCVVCLFAVKILGTPTAGV